MSSGSLRGESAMKSPPFPQYVHRLGPGFTQVMHTVVHSEVASLSTASTAARAASGSQSVGRAHRPVVGHIGGPGPAGVRPPRAHPQLDTGSAFPQYNA